ncbi:MAG: hypothetical protein WA705_23130 [Candidatus Ozemobacteraceae bacterium]
MKKKCIGGWFSFLFILLLGTAILSGSPGFASPLNLEAENLFKQAEESYKGKDLVKAATLLREALRKEPDNSFYRFNFGRVLLEKNDFLSAKENLDLVARAYPVAEKGMDYNEKLKKCKKKLKEMQERCFQEGEKKLSLYWKNQASKDKLKLAITLFQAFRLNQGLVFKNYDELKKVTEIYEKEFDPGSSQREWKQIPMLQLAFLYEIANKKQKASGIYMRALEFVEDDPNEEFIVTQRFNLINRPPKEILIDSLLADQLTSEDIMSMVSSDSAKVSDQEKKEIEDKIVEARKKLEEADSQEAREAALDEIRENLVKMQKEGRIPGAKKLDEKLKKEGKTMEEYLKEQGLK